MTPRDLGLPAAPVRQYSDSLLEEQLGLDASDIKGTGEGGIITDDDMHWCRILATRRKGWAFTSLSNLVAFLSVLENLRVAILPGRSGLDIQRLSSDISSPHRDSAGGKLRTVVGTNVIGHTPDHHQLGQGLDNV